MKDKYAGQLDWALDRPKTALVIATSDLWRHASAGAFYRRRVHAASR